MVGVRGRAWRAGTSRTALNGSVGVVGTGVWSRRVVASSRPRWSVSMGEGEMRAIVREDDRERGRGRCGRARQRAGVGAGAGVRMRMRREDET